MEAAETWHEGYPNTLRLSQSSSLIPFCLALIPAVADTRPRRRQHQHSANTPSDPPFPCTGFPLRNNDPRATLTLRSCDAHTTLMRPSCDSHATLMRPSCDSHATLMRLSCDHHATLMRSSYTPIRTPTACACASSRIHMPYAHQVNKYNDINTLANTILYSGTITAKNGIYGDRKLL